ncbi:MAG: glycerol-3-phosphate acyltransferase [Anaerolineales bacterium]|nr:glycerol-3-phosphate acyltransferase [Anaerolineales bacterium]
MPGAYLLVLWVLAVDVREHATGNVGTNNTRTVNAPWAFAVVAQLDAGKTTLPTWLVLQNLDLRMLVVLFPQRL